MYLVREPIQIRGPHTSEPFQKGELGARAVPQDKATSLQRLLLNMGVYEKKGPLNRTPPLNSRIPLY